MITAASLAGALQTKSIRSLSIYAFAMVCVTVLTARNTESLQSFDAPEMITWAAATKWSELSNDDRFAFETVNFCCGLNNVTESYSEGTKPMWCNRPCADAMQERIRTDLRHVAAVELVGLLPMIIVCILALTAVKRMVLSLPDPDQLPVAQSKSDIAQASV
jgi:hypothetical protein